MWFKVAAFVIAPFWLLPAARADNAIIAVATNFLDTATDIEARFEADGTHMIDIVAGATGKLYAQIKAGAPYDAFLSADQTAPQKLVDENLAVTGGAFTYAIGKLALYSANPNLFTDQNAEQFLLEGSYRYLAIANPELAPYGAAANIYLQNLIATKSMSQSVLKDRIVTGQNIGQAFTLVQSGAAEIGLVAYAQVLKTGAGGSFWLVPPSAYPPIKQDAVLLTRGADNAAAIAFLAFLKTDVALAIIKSHGYDRP